MRCLGVRRDGFGGRERISFVYFRGAQAGGSIGSSCMRDQGAFSAGVFAEGGFVSLG